MLPDFERLQRDGGHGFDVLGQTNIGRECRQSQEVLVIHIEVVKVGT